MPQHYFVALYCGESVSNARIVSASANPELIRIAVDKMLPELERVPEPDPIQVAFKTKRIGSLRRARGSA